MTSRCSLLPLVAGALLVLGAACTADAAPANGADPATMPARAPTTTPSTTPSTGGGGPSLLPSVVQRVVLPDGAVCEWAGFGATMAFDGKRLNYECVRAGGDTRDVLIGAFRVDGARVSIERARLRPHPLDVWVLDTSAIVEMEVARVELAGGTACSSTPGAAPRTASGDSAAFTCDLGVLLGDLLPGPDDMGISARHALIDAEGRLVEDAVVAVGVIAETRQVRVTPGVVRPRRARLRRRR